MAGNSFLVFGNNRLYTSASIIYILGHQYRRSCTRSEMFSYFMESKKFSSKTRYEISDLTSSQQRAEDSAHRYKISPAFGTYSTPSSSRFFQSSILIFDGSR